MSLVRGLIQPGLSAVKKAPFYSAVDEALAAVKRPKGTGAEFYTELTKQPGVKKAELADRKLEQAFKAKGKITKEEAQQILKDNPPPQVGERHLTEISDTERDNLLRDKIETSGYDSWDEVPSRKIRQWNEEIDEDLEKFGDYRTAGGQNYREILLKLPKLDTKDGDKNYWSTHFLQDPNVLAHMRVQDRKGSNGEKILHVEEIQSDWHQAGRKKGYKPDDYIEQSNALDREFFNLVAKRAELKDEAQRLGYFGEGSQALTEEANSITPKLMKLQEQRDNLQSVINYGVPEAPFKKNWHELAMKRLLNYAAENGYDSIAITPGAEQAKRYDLSKQVDKLVLFDDMTFRAYKGDNEIINRKVTPAELPDMVGQEVADRLLNAQMVNEAPSSRSGVEPHKKLSGIDLQVGGEGMKGFYDKMLPDYLNTFGKPYGAQVGIYDIDIPKMINVGSGAQTEVGRQQIPLHNFPITPEMRESIKQKGLPLYQQVGIPTVGAGAASQVPEQEEPEYSKGGSIAKQAALAKLKQMRGEMAPRAEAVKNIIARDQNRYLADVVPNSLTNAEIEAEIQRMAARARASGQQEGVLPRAERDANLAKFMKESKAPIRAFHGPGRHSGVTDIDQFKTTESGTGGAWFASNPDYAAEFGDGYTMPVHLNITNPVDLSKFGNRSLTVNQWTKAMQKAGVDTSEMQIKPARILGGANKQGEPNYDLWELLWRADDGQNNIPEILKKQGFDGILAPPEYDSKTPNYVVFEPTQVKSALGNRGTFDPNDPDIRKAKGGSVKPQVKNAVNGEVKITNNRDTMFMELSNKKLKRK
jgi:hypothetical protein